MRRISLAALAFVAAVSSAFADRTWIEASATLSLTLSETGESQSRANSNGTTSVTAKLERRRFGNADVITAMRQAGHISDTRGWRLIALWEDWSELTASYGYRFYLKKGKGAATELVEVPQSMLQLELLSSFASQKVKYASDESLLSGSESSETLIRLNFDTTALYFNTSGILKTTGRYVRPRGADSASYMPGSGKIALQGLHQLHRGYDVYTYGVTAGGLSFGSAKQVLIKESNGGGGGSAGPSLPDLDTSISVSVN